MYLASWQLWEWSLKLFIEYKSITAVTWNVVHITQNIN